jgi:nucleoside-diphosphate-sugar epimerase
MSDSTHVAVTGAAGYIGSRVVADIQERHEDWTVTAIDNFYLGDIREIGDVSVEHVDVRNRDRLEAKLEGAEVVLHLAAISGVDGCEEKPDLSCEVNVQGTNNVAWCCRKTGAALAFPFSMAVIGDPDEFPITVDMERDPLNWYGRSKVLGERAVATMAEGAFPAHQFMISNLYGGHTVGGRQVSKGTVSNDFVSRALAREPLTVYDPGDQARTFVHVRDVASAFVRSAERLLDERAAGETGSTAYEVATDEDPGVTTIAERVRRICVEEGGPEVDVVLEENPRDETLVGEFGVDTSRTREALGWEPEESVEATVRELLRDGLDG